MTAPAYVVSEVSARSPDMSDREFAEFVEDIRANGQLVPIWVRGDEVIDGRKRLAACRQLGIEPKVINLDPSLDGERISHALNILRTHYAPSQRAMFGAARANATKGDRTTPGHIRKNTDVVSVEQAAREVGVSQSYISKARQVMSDGTPEVVDAVKAGTLTLHAARNIVTEFPKDEQPAAVAKVITASKGLARQTPVGRIVPNVDVRLNRAAPKKPHEQFTRSIQLVEEGARVCLTNAPHVLDSAERDEWVRALTDARTAISRTLKTLER